jgi:hypothetical protein
MLGHCQEHELCSADGLLDALILDYGLIVARSPPEESSTESTRKRPRTRPPDGTAAGKRTLLTP